MSERLAEDLTAPRRLHGSLFDTDRLVTLHSPIGDSTKREDSCYDNLEWRASREVGGEMSSRLCSCCTAAVTMVNRAWALMERRPALVGRWETVHGTLLTRAGAPRSVVARLEPLQELGASRPVAWRPAASLPVAWRPAASLLVAWRPAASLLVARRPAASLLVAWRPAASRACRGATQTLPGLRETPRAAGRRGARRVASRAAARGGPPAGVQAATRPAPAPAAGPRRSACHCPEGVPEGLVSALSTATARSAVADSSSATKLPSAR
jgi:hypothetical protein